jgi:hypothetical protein
MKTASTVSSLLIVFLCSSFAIHSVCGATYYVSPSGDDQNPGTELLPWKTIQKAADTLTQSDTVYVKAGTYFERVVPAFSGTSLNRITYAAFPGDVVTIDGTGVSVPGWGGLFDVSGKDHITIDGFHIRDSSSNGILADGCVGVIISGNHTYNTVSSGIGVWNSNNVVVDSNEVELACNDGEQECITVAITSNFEVSNNEVHHSGPGNNGGEGIDIKHGSCNGAVHNNVVHHTNRLGIYVDAWDRDTYGIDVYANIVHDTMADGFAVAAENVTDPDQELRNIRFYNNIAYNNHWNGFVFAGWGESGALHPLKDIQVINNTFVNNGSSGWGGCVSIENPDITTVIFRNNICSQNVNYTIYVDPLVTGGYTAEYNLIDGFRGFPDEIKGTNYVEGDSYFADAAGANFHLQACSPAINAGTAIGAPSDDFDGLPRPVDGLYDLGAFEYQNTGTTFSLACSPSSFSLQPGSSDTAVCTICSIGGFNSPIDLSCSGLPADVTCSFDPTPVTPPPNGSVTSGLTIGVGAAAIGTTTMDAVGSSGAISETFPIELTVRPPCLFCDEFEDGVLAADWTYLKPQWTETGGVLSGTPAARKAIAVATPVFAGCQICSVEATMRTAGGLYNKLFLFGWYLDKKNRIDLVMSEEKDKWILKQRSGGLVVARAKALSTIDPHVDYDVLIDFEGTQFTVSVDGVTLMTMPAVGTVPAGTVGFAAKATTGEFERISVQ